MKKLLTLLTLALLGMGSAWADDGTLIVSWNTAPTLSNNSDGCTSTGTSNNVATWADGTSVKIMRSDKGQSNGSDITINGTKYKSIKVSNGAQNLLTMPTGKKAYSVTIYSYVNADSGNAYWSEVNGDDTQTTAMTSFKDGSKPDVRTYVFDSEGVTQFTFTNAGKQLCYVLFISTVKKETASLFFATTSGTADMADGVSFTLPSLTKTPSDATITYSSSNTDVATINNSTGAVTLVHAGTTTITASFAGNDSYTSATATFELTVTNSAAVTIDVTYDISGIAGIEGNAPASFEIDGGEAFTIPTNQTLYVEGKTLTGWQCGEDSYDLGQSVNAANTDMTLTPIFTDNATTAYLGHNASTVTWNFKKSSGAPIWDQLQGTGATTIYVTQATIGSNVIDVKMEMDATNGKIDNHGNDNWTQMNTGTKLTVPVIEGAILQLYVYKEGTSATTFGGEAGTFDSSKNIYSYTATTTGNLEIVFGECDQSYSSQLVVTYPSENAVYKHTTDNTLIELTKENIDGNDFLAVSSNNWNTGKTYTSAIYGTFVGDFYNMSNADRNITVKVTGASSFEVLVQNTNANRTYKIKVGNGEAQSITHGGSGIESSGLYTIADPTATTTITISGGGSSVYPVGIIFNPTVSAAITAASYATFSNASEVAIPEGVKAYYATQQDASTILLTEIEGGVIPAAEGVVLEGAEGTYTFAKSNTGAENITDNLLKANLTAGTPEESEYYTLAAGPKFVKSAGGILAAGKAYLVLPAGNAREMKVSFRGETTGITTVENTAVHNNYYNINGQRVAQPTKGLYILNGKKVMVK